MPKVPIAVDIELRFALWGRTPEHKIGEHATARAAQEPKRAVADCRMEPKYRLVLIYVRKMRLVMWRKAHGPGPNSAATFHVCDRLAGCFVRFDGGRAQLVRVAKAASLAASSFRVPLPIMDRRQ